MSDLLGVPAEAWITLVIFLPFLSLVSYTLLKKAMRSQRKETRIVSLAVASTIGSYFMATGIVQMIEEYLPGWLSNPLMYVIMGLIIVAALVTVESR